MTKLWVKLKPDINTAEVSTENCENIYQFIKEVKKEFAPDLDHLDPSQISLSLTDGGPVLQSYDPVPAQNTGDTPLFITIVRTPRVEQFTILDKFFIKLYELSKTFNDYINEARTVEIKKSQ